jgi:hypothetical protein
MDDVEFYEPPRIFFHISTGTWVDFQRQNDPQRQKRHGHVEQIQGTRATVIDEQGGKVCSNLSLMRIN